MTRALSNKGLHKSTNPLLEQAEYDLASGEIRIAGENWVLMTASTFRDVVKGTERILESGAVAVWLEAGRHAGRELSENLVRLGMEFEELPAVFEEFFTQGGWGKIQAKVDSTEREALVTIRNSATALQTNAKEPVCHFVRGFIAGVCDVMFHGPTECFETKCIAKGDAYCEFRVGMKQSC